jgi:hypothetical protein
MVDDMAFTQIYTDERLVQKMRWFMN